MFYVSRRRQWLLTEAHTKSIPLLPPEPLLFELLLLEPLLLELLLLEPLLLEPLLLEPPLFTSLSLPWFRQAAPLNLDFCTLVSYLYT